MTLTRILVPIALSPACAWAAQYGALLADRFGSELMYFHAGDCTRDTVEAFLAAAVEGTRHEITIRQGDPAEAIVEFAHETSPSMIVMPTHSYGRFRRFLLGSVTAKVLDDIDCPVLTGVHQEAVPRPVRAEILRIVCAVDAGEGSIRVFGMAREFGALFGATVTAVHAIPAADETSDNRGEIEIWKYLVQRAGEKLAPLGREAGVEISVSIAGGAVATVVREAALRERADLLVIGRGETQRTLGRLRTQAYSIIRHAPCPVLSV